ncbi:MAG: S24 family peptidase [Candidatus Paceibacterota bacterium]
MIKKRQKQVFDYIKLFASEHGFAPTLEEIQEKFKFKSISTAHYHVKKLKEAGYLDKDERRSRSLKTRDITFGSFLANMTPVYLSLPVIGSANCGPANIFAVEDPREYITVSSDSVGKRSKEGLFVVEAEGDSMNLAKVGTKKLSIEDGDYVVVDSNITSPTMGDYVLSIIDGCANIKKFKKIDGRLALVSESTSTKFKPIFLGSADDFMINGKIIGVLK